MTQDISRASAEPFSMKPDISLMPQRSRFFVGRTWVRRIEFEVRDFGGLGADLVMGGNGGDRGWLGL